MLVIVGLGNPGAAYKKSRHNVGFMLIDGIAEERFLKDVTFHQKSRGVLTRLFGSREPFRKSSKLYVSIEGELSGRSFLLVKPTTFINESGRTLSSLKRRGIIRELSEVLVVVDDVNLDIGSMRLRMRGSAGGHNGLTSIIEHLGTEEFARLRVGIGPRPNGSDLVKFVLGNFKPEEIDKIDESLLSASTVVEAFITGGFESAQAEIARL